ncbi:hypothetical protein [Brevundimonas vesicularis]|uniref:Uncharacterized protein n=1 Tax=Brevundimonas vesicularis TaxID=41276 RepID=A0ABU4KPD3_BREVE|nr:hypothetical protein [Brevundimonas vesicularis]MDX2334575.1 hypothetical protein [Brevundimonas vesicularis]
MTQAPTPGPLSAQQEEAIAFNLCSLHGFDPAFVTTQRDFAFAVIREYERARPSLAPAAPVEASGSERAAVLKGVGKVNGDGWKDTTTKGEVVFVWNAEKPSPYAPGQYPRVGNDGWSASTSQYDFAPATADDVPAILAALARAHPSPTPAAPVEASGPEREREHGPMCWGKTSVSDEMMYCYCGSPDARPQPSGETREAVLKGVGKVNGDGWKDTTTEGEIVFVWNAEKPTPYAAGQYPRIGNEGWSASTSQYDFTPATAKDVPTILAHLSARPLALGGQHSTATDFPPDDVLACMDDTTPARAEAQDEGAAGEQTDNAFKIASDLHAAYEQLIYGLPKYLDAENLTDEENMIREAYITLDVTAHRLAAVSDTHPSPTPAADADRVRIAVEALEVKINAPLTGPTHGAWDRGRISGLKEALAALKSSEVEKMSAQRRDLIKRLAKAECGSRELDKAIFEATSPPAEYAEWSPRLRGYQYTTSIDAALSWAEWVLPGQEWRFGSGTRDTTLPWARIGRWAEPDAVGATPALAICGAILIALNRAEIEATRSPSATLAALKSTAAKEGGEG